MLDLKHSRAWYDFRAEGSEVEFGYAGRVETGNPSVSDGWDGWCEWRVTGLERLKAQVGIDLPLQRLIGPRDSGGFGHETLLWT